MKRKAERLAAELLESLSGERRLMRWRVVLCMMLQQIEELRPEVRERAYRKYAEFLIVTSDNLPEMTEFLDDETAAELKRMGDL